MKVESCKSTPSFSGKIIYIKRGVPGEVVELVDDLFVRNAKEVSPVEFCNHDFIVLGIKKLESLKDKHNVTIWLERLGNYVSAFQKTPKKSPEAIFLNLSVDDANTALTKGKFNGNTFVVPENFSGKNKTFVPYREGRY